MREANYHHVQGEETASPQVFGRVPYMITPMPDLSWGSNRKPNLGLCKGHYGKPKNTDNSPTRAKGMQPFDVDGMTIYAGTIGGAKKKARILKHA